LGAGIARLWCLRLAIGGQEEGPASCFGVVVAGQNFLAICNRSCLRICSGIRRSSPFPHTLSRWPLAGIHHSPVHVRLPVRLRYFPQVKLCATFLQVNKSHFFLAQWQVAEEREGTPQQTEARMKAMKEMTARRSRSNGPVSQEARRGAALCPFPLCSGLFAQLARVERHP